MENFKENFSTEDNETPKRVRVQYLAAPIGADPRTHIYEAEYDHYKNGVSKLVPGSVKDLGPINEEEKEKFKSERDKEDEAKKAA
ncbi:MAG: hypothetical protein M1334_00030 [Patescibacteria group bacterium]|nr:hypothetical protein [Patescibacteria group bacterium]